MWWIYLSKDFKVNFLYDVEHKVSYFYLTGQADQIRRSSRSVAANIAEAFRKRRYPKAFVSKLSDSEAEAAETQVWLKFSFECGYLNKKVFNELYQNYDYILGKLVNMSRKPENWTL